MTIKSPYQGIKTENWIKVTQDLIKRHPLPEKHIVAICKKSWEQIFNSSIGGVIKIGEQIALTPQMLGNFIHILIAHHLEADYPKLWRGQQEPEEKDIVYIPDETFSFEIKTSSSKNDIYGNRSYGQPQAENSRKTKDGYYLAINFSKTLKGKLPAITKIRFGWLDHSDWVAQVSPTGQQSHLTKEAKLYKLIILHEA